MRIEGKYLALALAAALVLSVGCKKRAAEGYSQQIQDPKMDADTLKGKQLFVIHTCATCHGPEGLGDGPAGARLKPLPRNFHRRKEYKFGFTYDKVLHTIKNGYENGMKSYKYIPDDERILLAKFIVYLQESPGE